MSIDSLAVGMPMEAQVALLWKRASKLFDRIDRRFDEIHPAVPDACRHVSLVKSHLRRGDYYMFDPSDKKKHLRQIDFERVAMDLSELCYGSPSIDLLPAKLRDELVYERIKQYEERLELLQREAVRDLEKRNDLPQISGRWRKEPYPVRSYEHLTYYVPASLTAPYSGLIETNTNDNPENKNSLELKQLDTELEGYLGQPYNYNDGELTEEWMSSFQDVAPSAAAHGPEAAFPPAAAKGGKKKKGGKDAASEAAAKQQQQQAKTFRSRSVEDNIIRPTQDDVIRIQLENLIEIMKIQVQDRVCTENKILTAVPPVDLGDVLKEMPVWGIDSHTRRMIEIAIEDNSPVYRAMLTLPDQADAASADVGVGVGVGVCGAAGGAGTAGAGAAGVGGAGAGAGDMAESKPSSDREGEAAGAGAVGVGAVSAGAAEPTKRGRRVCLDAIVYFIESVALPAVNTLDSADAHDMRLVMGAILAQCDSSNPHRLIRNYRSFVADFASAVLLGIDQYGAHRFRIHPKGTGVVVCEPTLQNDRNMNTLNSVGIPPHVVICPYLGELYLPYRWCEKLDVVEQAQQKYNLKPTLPDFYNILLERPRHDKKGYGLLYVDASQRANMGSSCSHSCNANCTSNVVSRNGKLCIVLTTNRWIYPGEELCMDYYSVTNSEVEWRASICLCGSKNCRGTFLHYAAQDDLQQVLTRNCGILWRYATLLRACSHVPLSALDKRFLSEHGMGEAVFGFNSERRREDAAAAAARLALTLTASGATPAPEDGNKMDTDEDGALLSASVYDYAGIPDWVLKYASDNLRFIEYERKALPMALMRTNNASKQAGLFGAGESAAVGGLPYTFTEADIEARSVMEQRIQSFVSCYSMIMQVLDGQSREGSGEQCNPELFPLRPLPVTDAIVRVQELLATIPQLLHKYVVLFHENRAKAATEAANATAAATTAAATAAAVSVVKDENAANGVTDDAPTSAGGAVPVPAATSDVKKKPGKKNTGGVAVGSGSGGSSAAGAGASAAPVPLHSDVDSAEAVRCATAVIADLYAALGMESPHPRYRRPAADPAAVAPAAVAPAAVTEGSDAVSIAVEEPASRAQHDHQPQPQPEPVFVPPRGFAAMRQLVLKVRAMVESLVRFSTSEARLLLLCDMLVLWANTSHYSMVRPFTPVDSEPIRVVARELGTNISRSKLAAAAAAAASAATGKEGRAERASQRASAALAAREEEMLMDVMQASMQEAAAAASSTDSSEAAQATATATAAASGSEEGGEAAAAPQSTILDANELVFEGKKTYGKYFAFWQLMQWFNAGTDDKVTESDMFGCVQLPLPAACFGPCAGSRATSGPHSGKEKGSGSGSGQYSVKSPQRRMLLELISSERLQINPWPAVLKDCFNGLFGSESDLPASFGAGKRADGATTTAVHVDWYLHALMGSPLLDISLGQMDALLRVRMDFAASQLEAPTVAAADKEGDIFTRLQNRNDQNASNSHANSQFDSVLPPELPAQWIQCDLCKKWRRIAWHIDHNIEQERETWTCANNTWDPEKAYCEAELDWFDADAENTLNVGNAGGEGELACGSVNIEDYKIGSWYDVFCNRNLLYYEAKVVAHKQPRCPVGCSVPPLPQVQFFFKGWGKRFGEWIEVGSERIQQHNLFTTPTECGNAMAITKIQMEHQATNGTLLSSSVGILAGQEKAFASAGSKKKKASKAPQGKGGAAKANKKQKTK